MTDTGIWPLYQAAEDGTPRHEDTSLRVCRTCAPTIANQEEKRERLYRSTISVMLRWHDSCDVSDAWIGVDVEPIRLAARYKQHGAQSHAVPPDGDKSGSESRSYHHMGRTITRGRRLVQRRCCLEHDIKSGPGPRRERGLSLLL